MKHKKDMYERLRTRLQNWAETKTGKENKWLEYILLLPDLLRLLCGLTLDPDVPVAQKGRIGIAVAYIISPVDVIPEALVGPIGYVDDVALAAHCINHLFEKVDEAIILKHWKGDADLLKICRHILAVTDDMVGAGLWSRVKGAVGL